MPLSRFAPFNMSLRSKAVSTPDLRPCQNAYLGESNARRLLKRSQLSKKARNNLSQEEPIFALHEEAALEAAAAAAVPFHQTPPTGYSVQCYATFAEDEQKRRDAEVAEKEKMVLLNSINSSRHAEGTSPLRMKPILAKYAQDYADMLFSEDINNSHHSAADPKPIGLNSVVVVMAPSGARVARLVSPPRIGALACGEMWYGGKYRRHLYNLESVAAHPDDCPCHLRIVFETMVDEAWKAIGIGRGEDGRWVVELGQ